MSVCVCVVCVCVCVCVCMCVEQHTLNEKEKSSLYFLLCSYSNQEDPSLPAKNGNFRKM